MVGAVNNQPSDYKTSERNSQNTIFNNKESSINFEEKNYWGEELISSKLAERI